MDGKKRRKGQRMERRYDDKKMNIKNVKRSEGRKNFGLCSFHLQAYDPRNPLRVIPVPRGLSTTLYTILQFN